MGIASSYAAVSNADTARRQEERARKQQEYTQRAAGFTRDDSGKLIPTDLRTAQEGVQKSQMEIMQEQLNAQQQAIAAQQAKMNADGITNILASVVEGNWKDAYGTWNKTPGLKDALRAAPTLDINEIGPVNFSDPNDLAQLKSIGIDTSKVQDPEVQEALLSSLMKVQGKDGSWRVVPVDAAIKQTNSYNMFTSAQEKMYNERMQKINSVVKGLSPAQVEAQETKAQTEIGTGQVTQEFIQDLQAQVESGTLSPEEAFRKLTTPPQALNQRRDSLKQVEEVIEKLKDPKLPADERANLESWLKKATTSASYSTQERSLGDLAQERKRASEIVQSYDGKPETLQEARDIQDQIVADLEETEKAKVKKTEQLVETNYNTAAGVDRILTGYLDGDTKDVVDADIISSAKTWANKNLGNEVQASLKKVQFDTEAGMLLAGYIKELSGTAASDAEVQRLTNIFLAGKYTDEAYIKASMEAFRDSLRERNKTLLANYEDTLPYTTLAYTRGKPKSKVDLSKYVTDSASSKPAVDLSQFRR